MPASFFSVCPWLCGHSMVRAPEPLPGGGRHLVGSLHLGTPGKEQGLVWLTRPNVFLSSLFLLKFLF